MNAFRRSQLSDHVLLQSCREHVSRERRATAELLADLAEVDARKLYARAGYASLYAWCVGELGLSEDATCLRTRAARAGRDFPAVLVAIADGRLHLTGACLLAPRLTPENVDELIAAATHRSKAQIEELLAERFARPDVPTLLEPVAGPECGNVSVPERMIFTEAGQSEAGTEPVASVATSRAVPAHHTRVAPLSPGRFELRGTLDADAHADLRAAQELLGVHAGDPMAVIAQALKLLRRDLERRRCGAAEKPRDQRRSASSRTISRAVRREVWRRDRGQCTYTSDSGHRCEERKGLELDHITPVARGGESTASNLRLSCRTHNLMEAEHAIGAPFMNGKREAARARKLERERQRDQQRAARAESEAHRAAAAQREAELRERAAEVVPWLRSLGFRADEARRAAERSAQLPEAPLEERVRVALQGLAPLRARQGASGG